MQKYEFFKFLQPRTSLRRECCIRESELGEYLVTLKEIINLKETIIDLE